MNQENNSLNAEVRVADQQWLDTLFPQSRTEAFFEALFGGAEEGAYDIRLIHRANDEQRLEMAFLLTERPGHCLRCNLTYGLPEVFARHPILDVKGIAKTLAEELNWECSHWELKHTHELSAKEHMIPFILSKD